MKTLIIPCAGASSRFPNMRPKWMLTHPDGKLMIVKSIEGFNYTIFDKIIIVILQKHIDAFDADVILAQAFSGIKHVEIFALPAPTRSASETIYQTVKLLSIYGEVVVKDSDNFVELSFGDTIINSVGSLNIYAYNEEIELRSKSFLLINDQEIITDIIEKRISSDQICVGVYTFNNIAEFCTAYEDITKSGIEDELYISHVISYMICVNNIIFHATHIVNYEDWGRLIDWRKIQEFHSTYFVDFDGVCITNSGRYGKINWSNNDHMLEENLYILRELQNRGSQIVITTSRTEEYKEEIERKLLAFGIQPHAILVGLNHAPRVLINDFSATNPYPSASAVNLPRNGELSKYFSVSSLLKPQ